MKRKDKVLFYVIGVIAFIAVLGAFAYINMSSDPSNDTSETHPLNSTAQANDFAERLMLNQYSIPLIESKLNPKDKNQVWVYVNADNYSDDELAELGKQVVKDYYDKFHFKDASVAVADTSHARVIVKYDNGKNDVLKLPSE